MICTKCSSPVRPIVALDLDGTLGDYHMHFLNFLAMYLGGYVNGRLASNPLAPGVKKYTGEQRFREWCCETYEIDTRTYRDIKLAYRQGAQKRSMPVFPHAREMVRCIRDVAEVWITTTRPYMRLDAVDPDTRFWLKRHGIKYDYMLYDDRKYELLRRQVDPARVAAILDDQHDDLWEAQLFFERSACLLYANSWNSAYAQSWDTVDSRTALDAILEKVEAWKTAHSLSE